MERRNGPIFPRQFRNFHSGAAARNQAEFPREYETDSLGLVACCIELHKRAMSDEIFSRERRRLNRHRARSAEPGSQWLLDRMAEELADRLIFMKLDIRRVLVIGHGRMALGATLPSGAEIVCCDLVDGSDVDVVADEDRLPVDAGSFDLVVACGMLDTIHDLPGALILMRRALRPGGLFLGAMLGGGSLGGFRQMLQTAEMETSGRAVARFHPQIDVRSAGDLLFRAGFSMPVVDQDNICVNYSSLDRLLEDLRATGSGNALPHITPLPRSVYQLLLAKADKTELLESFAPIYMTGWSPEADEKRPAGPVKGFL